MHGKIMRPVITGRMVMKKIMHPVITGRMIFFLNHASGNFLRLHANHMKLTFNLHETAEQWMKIFICAS